MKHKLLTIIGSALLAFSFSSCSEKPAEKLLLGGSGWNKVAIIDKDSKQIEWEYPLEKGWECNSVVATPEGNVLFSYGKGAKMIDSAKQEIWNIEAPDSCEMQTARMLSDGNYLLAWCGHPIVIMEVSPKGDIITKTQYESGIENPHSQFRQVNKNSKGNYLIPFFATSEIREVNPQGEVVGVTRLEGTPFTTVQKADGNYWVACGDAHSLAEVNLSDGQIVKRYGESDIEGAKLFFVAGLLPTQNDGLYICNWQGHDSKAVEANSPQLFEMDKDGKMIWSLNDNKNFGMISAVDVVKK